MTGMNKEFDKKRMTGGYFAGPVKTAKPSISIEDTKKSMADIRSKNLKLATDDLRTHIDIDFDAKTFMGKRQYDSIAGFKDLFIQLMACLNKMQYAKTDRDISVIIENGSDRMEDPVFIIDHKDYGKFKWLCQDKHSPLINPYCKYWSGQWIQQGFYSKLTDDALTVNIDLQYLTYETHLSVQDSRGAYRWEYIKELKKIIFWIANLINLDCGNPNGRIGKQCSQKLPESLINNIETAIDIVHPELSEDGVFSVFLTILLEYGKLKEDIEHDYRLLSEILSYQPLYENMFGVSVPVKINLTGFDVEPGLHTLIEDCCEELGI